MTSRAEMWNTRYGVSEYIYGTEPNGFLTSMVDQLQPGSRVLCLADGEGRNGVYLASQGFAVSTIDQSEPGVDKARSLARQVGVDIDAVVGDLAEVDLGVGKWDAIVSIFAHMPQDVRADLHSRAVVALAPGGLFILEAYTPDQVGRGTGGPPVPELTMTLAALRNELPELIEVHAVETERDVVEGSGHSGLGAVVQFVGRKSATS